MIKEFQKLVMPKYKEDYYYLKLIVTAYLQKKEELEQLDNKINEECIIKKPTGLSKALNTNSYKEYLEKIYNMEKLNNQRIDLENELQEFKKVYDQVYPDYIKKEQQITDINNLDKPEVFKTYYQMIIDILKENNIPVVLTEEEQQMAGKLLESSEKELNSMDDIILVHKTSRPVAYDTVTTPYLSNDFTVVPFTINGKSYLSDVKYHENSIHFAANSSKNSHEEKNKQKYAVITSIKDIPKEKMLSNLHDDIYMIGNLDLKSNTIILCPKSDYIICTQNNRKAKVIAYEGNLEDSINTILAFLDMPIIDLESKNINEVNNGKNYYTILKENGYDKTVKYEDSTIKKAEELQEILNRIIGIVEMVKTKPELWEISPETILYDTSFYEDVKYISSISKFALSDRLEHCGIYITMDDIDINGYIDIEYAKAIILKVQAIGKNETQNKSLK